MSIFYKIISKFGLMYLNLKNKTENKFIEKKCYFYYLLINMIILLIKFHLLINIKSSIKSISKLKLFNN